MYGIQIYNTYNNITIDNTYKGYTLFDSGTTSVTSGVNFIDFTPTSNNPIFVYSPAISGAAAFSTFGFDGTTYSGAYIGADSSYDLDWRVYTVISGTTSSGNGLVIYNDSDELTYDSRNQKLMKVNYIYYPNMSEGTTITTVSGGYYYIDGYNYTYNITYNYADSYVDVQVLGLQRNSATELELKELLIYHEDFSDTTTGSTNGAGDHWPNALIEIV